jgi:integrase
VLPELRPFVDEIRAAVGPHDAVLSSDGSRWQRGKTKAPLDHTTLGRIVRKITQRAGIDAKVSCHTLRYAFATMIAREAGLRAAQALLGHASIETTARIYVDAPTMDEIREAVDGVSYVGVPTKARPNLVLLSA